MWIEAVRHFHAVIAPAVAAIAALICICKPTEGLHKNRTLNLRLGHIYRVLRWLLDGRGKPLPAFCPTCSLFPTIVTGTQAGLRV